VCAAREIARGFQVYNGGFRQITHRARQRFEAQDWAAMQTDAVERLDLYSGSVAAAHGSLSGLLGDRIQDRRLWSEIRAEYAGALAPADDAPLARTFFNSITRRVFATAGVDPEIEFLDTDAIEPAPSPAPVESIACGAGLEAALRSLLVAGEWQVPWEDLGRDTRRVEALVRATVAGAWGGGQAPAAIDLLAPVFFRRKGAYQVARLRSGDRLLPLVIALLNRGGRIAVDAVLLAEEEVSIVFSFTRSYFHADLDEPHGAVAFLQSILPRKPVAELYIALGYNKHGKTELYRQLRRHLEGSHDRFEIAPGDRGMVMLVFTLPSYDLVFKVIRDRFAPPKTATRAEVVAKYQLVFRHDRAGRLVDAQEFEHLAFAAERFSEGLLQELTASAAASVRIEAGQVVIRHLYVERRVVPLNLFLREADPAAARDAVLDYGQTIKDLAATNIFPGDLLLKNFGVTRHGRVIFYDYDELCLLGDCNFRDLPAPRDLDDEMSAEPWFYVGSADVFPEEFARFLGLEGELRRAFVEAHGDLLTAPYWRGMQARHRSGEVIDIFPYAAGRRLGAAEPAP
jgi:isocitrate dehydrogenase kinase/phosphatase